MSPVMTRTERLSAIERIALGAEESVPSLDRLARLAARLLDAPISLVSIVTPELQANPGQVGLPEPFASTREMPLELSTCQFVVASGEVLVIDDATTHELVCDNHALLEAGMRAYVGIPLRAPDSEVLGSFCVIATEPRVWSAVDIETLGDLAESVASELELRARLAEVARLSDDVARLENMLPVCAWCRRVDAPDHGWEPIDLFLAREREEHVTHGICPDCFQEQTAMLDVPGDVAPST